MKTLILLSNIINVLTIIISIIFFLFCLIVKFCIVANNAVKNIYLKIIFLYGFFKSVPKLKTNHFANFK